MPDSYYFLLSTVSYKYFLWWISWFLKIAKDPGRSMPLICKLTNRATLLHTVLIPQRQYSSAFLVQVQKPLSSTRNHSCRPSSVSQFSRSVVSSSLQPHGLQHTRPPCPSLTPKVDSNSCPLNRWCHPTISSYIIPFSSCLQSFPASGSFQMSWFFTSGSHSIGVSASASVLPMNTQDWSPLGWTGWISLSPRDSQESSPTPQFKSINFSALSFLHSPTLTSIHDH